MKKALFYGILGSLFFAFTFIFNRSMNLTGGYWIWSACLRYIFTLPMMWILVRRAKGVQAVFDAIKRQPMQWILWSTVGFGLFYLPLTMASNYGESWFVAATWQLTIVCGVMLTPLFGKPIPKSNLLCSFIILVGVALLQVGHIADVSLTDNLTALALILVAAFSYPLGNRKMMGICGEEMTTTQRVFGMTLCSMPFWLVFSVVALVKSGIPSGSQCVQSISVALFSGVIATMLFFEATNLVRGNHKELAVIEATQSGEVIFTLIGGILFLGDSVPTMVGFIGIVVIVAGMVANSLVSGQQS